MWILIGVVLFAVQTYNARLCTSPLGCMNVWSNFEFIDMLLLLIGAAFIATAFLASSKPKQNLSTRDDTVVD